MLSLIRSTTPEPLATISVSIRGRSCLTLVGKTPHCSCPPRFLSLILHGWIGPSPVLRPGVPAMATSSDPHNWKNVAKHPKRGVPEGLWKRCPGCQATIFRKEAEKRLGVCPECDYHWYVSARQRVRQLFNEGTFEEWDAEMEPADPLEFVDKSPYREKLKQEQRRTGLRDAAVVGTGMIRRRRVAFGVTDSAFIMGSMGSVVGEKLAHRGAGHRRSRTLRRDTGQRRERRAPGQPCPDNADNPRRIDPRSSAYDADFGQPLFLKVSGRIPSPGG